MGFARVCFFPCLGQPAESVFAHGFEHDETRFGKIRSRSAHQAVIHQGFDRVQQIDIQVFFRVANGLDGFVSGASDKDGHPAEELLLLQI